MIFLSCSYAFVFQTKTKQQKKNAFNEKSTTHFLLYWRELPIQAQRLVGGTTGAGQAEIHTQKLKNEK